MDEQHKGENERLDTILVVDDDPKITTMLRRVLMLEGYDVKIANDGETGLALALEDDVDLVVLDIMLPGLSGWEICQYVRKKSQVPILMLTARDQVEDRVKGLDTGADDYLVKPFALEEMLARVRALIRRAQATSPKNREAREEQLCFSDLTLNQATREAWRGQRRIVLTATEYALLEQLLLHPRRVLSREFLMDRVWGYDYVGESNVLEVYVANLRQKLEACGEARLIQTVRGVGYVLRENEEVAKV